MNDLRQQKHAVRRAGAPNPVSSYVCEPTGTAQPHGDDAHAVVARLKWVLEHRLRTVCGPLRQSVASLACRQMLKTRSRAEVNVRLLRLVKVNRQIV